MAEASLRDVMRAFPQGVVVVTAGGEDGPRGITVSSFISVSLSPPLVLIAIMKQSQAHPAIDRGKFVVNVLSEEQGAVSDHFAIPHLTSEDQFKKYIDDKASANGEPPVLEGCLGYLHCNVVGRIEQSDHTLFVGEVERAEMGEEGKPLVFYSRKYWGLGSTVYERS